MKNVRIVIPARMTLTAVCIFELWKGNVEDSVAGIDKWLGEKTEVVITDKPVLGLFRLAHAKGLINVVSVNFTVAEDGRLSRWQKSVLDLDDYAKSGMLDLIVQCQPKNGTSQCPSGHNPQ